MFIRTLALMLATVGLLVPTQSASAAPDNFTPRSGPTFNSPLGDKSAQRAIFRKIMRSINSSPRGSEIHIFTWNFLTREGTDALLRAQRRGVRVRVLMDSGNMDIDGVTNTPYRRLRSGLRNGNDGRPRARRSWARMCQNSCRGKGGAAHSKFFVFSEVGKARRVVIQGSANFTVASTTNQWNDVFTHVGNRAPYKFALRVFREASADKRQADPYTTKRFGGVTLMMLPNYKRMSRDPVLRLLNEVTCRGAKNTRSGRTVIRIAPDVIRHDRGMVLAKKVRRLWESGCDVKIGYTVLGIEIGRMLRDQGGRGPVPMKHLVQDHNGDGQFDNYFHLKAMTIRGNVGGNARGVALLNGSANWSGLAKVSDENLGIYRQLGPVNRYQKHIDYWYDNFPSSARTGSARTTVGGDRLVFGSGTDAVYEDGTPVGRGDFNPFANNDEVE